MRRYNEPVEVRRGRPDNEPVGEGPAEFIWRGQLWKVRSILNHWVETDPWWKSPAARAAIGDHPGDLATAPAVDLVNEREVWRVEAGRGVGAGVFDLELNFDNAEWRLLGCVD